MNTNTIKKFDLELVIRLISENKFYEAEKIADKLLTKDKIGYVGWKIKASIYSKKGEIRRALNYYKRYISNCPKDIEANLEYAFFSFNNGCLDDAAVALLRILKIDRDHLKANFLYGRIQTSKGQYDEAIISYTKSLEQNDSDYIVYLNLGACYHNLKKYDEAEKFYNISLALKKNEVTLVNIGILYEDKGLIEDALQSYKQAMEINSRYIRSALRFHLAMPVIYENNESIDFWRTRYLNGLRSIMANGNYKLKDPLLESLPGSFILSYHNRNNVILKQKTGEMYSKIINISSDTSKEKIKNNKIKIGFVSNFFKNHTIGKLNQGLIKKLDKNMFETIIFHGPALKKDSFTNFINDNCDKSIYLSGGYDSQLELIRSENLDVLIFTDIGMDMHTYFLAINRCAKSQIVMWGHPDTTGIKNIDYFLISKNIAEEGDLKKYYSEKLIITSRLPSYYEPMSLPVGIFQRKIFGLSDDDKLYACPQSLFKIHPDFDDVLIKISEADSNAKILFIEPEKSSWKKLLLDRWSKKSKNFLNKVIFIHPLPLEDFMRLVAIVDVLLDPLYFGSGNTMYESFCYGTPIVTMPTEYMRGRIVAAAYKQMNIKDAPICQNIEEYVNKSVLIANNKEYRKYISNQILKKAGVELYSDMKFIQEFEAAIKYVAK